MHPFFQSTLLLSLTHLWLTPFVTALNFQFTTSNPTQCDSMTITWEGGKAPITATISPPFGTLRNTTLQSNGSGIQSSSVFVPFPKGQSILVTLSDATGFASGGTSNLLTVGSSVSGTNCNTTEPGVDFFYQFDTSLAQCQQFFVDGWNGAVQPVTLSALIPGGEAVAVTAPISSNNSFIWTANAKAGTSFVFNMVDAAGRNGGTSNVTVVGNSADTSCLSNAVSSTPAGTLSVIPPTKTASQSSTSSSTPSKGGLSTGAIVGIVVAPLTVLIGILITYWWLKRRPNFDDIWPDATGSVNLDDRGTYEPVTAATGQYAVTPFADHVTSPPAQGGQFPSTGYPQQSMHTSAAFPPGQPYPLGQQAVPGMLAYNQIPMAYGAAAAPPVPGVVPYISPNQQQQSLPQQQPLQQAPQLAHAPSTASGAAMSINRSSVMDTSDAYTAYTGGSSDAGLLGNQSTSGKSTSGPPTEERASRFVVHTDITESDVVELPPQYSESRAPMPENLSGLQ